MKYLILCILFLFIFGCTETKTKVVYRECDGLPLNMGVIWYEPAKTYYQRITEMKVTPTGYREYVGEIRPMTYWQARNMIIENWITGFNMDDFNKFSQNYFPGHAAGK